MTTMTTPFSRRSFLKMGGVTAAGLAVTSAALPTRTLRAQDMTEVVDLSHVFNVDMPTYLLGEGPTRETFVTVKFREPVVGVTADDFALTTSGLGGASILGVTALGEDTYKVSVNTGTGTGSVRLDLVDDDSIADAAGNTLGGAGEVGTDQSPDPRRRHPQPRRQQRRLPPTQLVQRDRQVPLHDPGGVRIGLPVSEQ